MFYSPVVSCFKFAKIIFRNIAHKKEQFVNQWHILKLSIAKKCRHTIEISMNFSLYFEFPHIFMALCNITTIHWFDWCHLYSFSLDCGHLENTNLLFCSFRFPEFIAVSEHQKWCSRRFNLTWPIWLFVWYEMRSGVSWSWFYWCDSKQMSLSCSWVSDICPDVSNKWRSLGSVSLALESRADIWI